MVNRCEQGLHSHWRPASLGSSGGGSRHGGRHGGRQEVFDEGHRMMSPYIQAYICSYGQGSVRAASGTTLGVLGTSKMKENKRFYGFTDFRGKPAGRGRNSHATLNQASYMYMYVVPDADTDAGHTHTDLNRHLFCTVKARGADQSSQTACSLRLVLVSLVWLSHGPLSHQTSSFGVHED